MDENPANPQRLGKLWRCMWLARELISVELASPPVLALASLAEGTAVQLVRAALLRCVEVPGDKDQHACFVEAATLDLALARAHDLHPHWVPS